MVGFSPTQPEIGMVELIIWDGDDEDDDDEEDDGDDEDDGDVVHDKNEIEIAEELWTVMY